MYNKFQHKLDTSKLWVVTMISNPMRYRSRYDLYNRFSRRMIDAGANTQVVEVAFGDRPHEITEHHSILQLRTEHEMWHKENALNLAIAQLPSDWEQVCWIDADIEFVRHDWMSETVAMLHHHDVIQMFQTAVDMGPNGEVVRVSNGFGYGHWSGEMEVNSDYYGAKYFHPGFAWAMTRDAFEKVGGLFDVGILGSGDYHMATALIGKAERAVPKDMSDGYKRHLFTWQERASHLRHNLGYMRGSIIHHYHGNKKDRGYNNRWKILTDHNYDPDHDIQRDSQGLYKYSHKGLRMRSDVMKYFESRNEDS